jgi:colicin import membrane protein
MSTNHTHTPETSVMFSLAELADIEQERVREEAQQRAAAERERELARQAELEAQREAEQARQAAEVERREQVERERAEARARQAAQERAAAEVARIEAEAKAKLAAENAARDHELKRLAIESQSGRTRLRRTLASVIAVVLLGGSAAAWTANGHVDALAASNQKLRNDRFALEQTHDQALSSSLTALDVRHAKLRKRAESDIAEQARIKAEAARSAIEAGGMTAAKLRAFGDALDVLELRADLAERVAAADRRYGDLSRWAHDKGVEKALAPARRAATTAHAAASNDAKATAYEKALDELAATLAGAKGNARVARGRVPSGSEGQDGSKTTTPGTACTNPHDPMCGLDGQMLGSP